MKKTRRLLLATAALSTAAAVEACTKEPLPGNPKGSHYEDAEVAMPANPKGSHYDQGLDAGPTKPDPITTDTSDAGQKPLPLPANPKGSHYDSGLKPKPAPSSSAKK